MLYCVLRCTPCLLYCTVCLLYAMLCTLFFAGPSPFPRPDCPPPYKACTMGTNPGRTHRFYTGKAGAYRCPCHIGARRICAALCTRPTRCTPSLLYQPFLMTLLSFLIPHPRLAPLCALLITLAPVEVVPFGFGLSYTTFAYGLASTPEDGVPVSLAPAREMIAETRKNGRSW